MDQGEPSITDATMPRRHRFIATPSSAPVVVAVMTRCHQRRCLLVKTREAQAKRLFWGVWGHALARHPGVRLGSLVTQPNHYHALLILERPCAELLGDFMALVNGNLAREMNRQLGRAGAFWERRYSASLVAPSAILSRLRYDHRNGVKSGDYAHPCENPLPNTTDAQRFGRPLCGHWVRRAELAAARARSASARASDFTDVHNVVVAPLPVPGDFDGAVSYRALMCREIAKAAEIGLAERDARGIRGRKLSVLMRLDPLTRPRATKRGTPSPFAFGTLAETKPLWAQYRQMRAAQLAALKRLAVQLEPCGWPEPACRPPPLRMAAAALAERASAQLG